MDDSPDPEEHTEKAGSLGSNNGMTGNPRGGESVKAKSNKRVYDSDSDDLPDPKTLTRTQNVNTKGKEQLQDSSRENDTPRKVNKATASSPGDGLPKSFGKKAKKISSPTESRPDLLKRNA